MQLMWCVCGSLENVVVNGFLKLRYWFCEEAKTFYQFKRAPLFSSPPVQFSNFEISAYLPSESKQPLFLLLGGTSLPLKSRHSPLKGLWHTFWNVPFWLEGRRGKIFNSNHIFRGGSLVPLQILYVFATRVKVVYRGFCRLWGTFSPRLPLKIPPTTVRKSL